MVVLLINSDVLCVQQLGKHREIVLEDAKMNRKLDFLHNYRIFIFILKKYGFVQLF
jgi:hypothetical protein